MTARLCNHSEEEAGQSAKPKRAVALHHKQAMLAAASAEFVRPGVDNWGDADNRLARDRVQGMLPVAGLFAYVEVRPQRRPSGLGSTLSEINHPHSRSLLVTDRQQSG